MAFPHLNNVVLILTRNWYFVKFRFSSVGEVFLNAPGMAGDRPPPYDGTVLFRFFFRWAGSKRYKNVTFCNIFSAFLCPFVGQVFPREDPCELELFPRFGVSIFFGWGGVSEDYKNVIL